MGTTISQNANDIQEVISSILHGVPMVLVDDDKNVVYILIAELSKELEDFIRTGQIDTDTEEDNKTDKDDKTDKAGKTDTEEGEDTKRDPNVFSVFSNEYKQELIKQWHSSGIKYKTCSQYIWYMGHHVTIEYLQVYKSETDVQIFLLPWFLIRGKPYPIFAYTYGVCHYYNSEKKSMSLSAAAVENVFGIIGFNKSTISRTIKSMKPFIRKSQLDIPQPDSESATTSSKPSSVDIRQLIPQLLNTCPSAVSLREVFEANNGQMPVAYETAISYATSLIPKNLFDVIKIKKSVREKPRDKRKRPARKRQKNSKDEKPKPVFVASEQITQTRLSFIDSCKSVVLSAAIKFHRLLL